MASHSSAVRLEVTTVEARGTHSARRAALLGAAGGAAFGVTAALMRRSPA